MEIIEEAISRAVRYRKFNSLITETFELARAQAREALRLGKTPFPVVVKDCYMTKKVRTTCASRNLSSYTAPYTATIVDRLFLKVWRLPGGCLIGKANMDEFCMGTSSSKGYFGPVKNGLSNEQCLESDWRSPGGSSGGCAVAVQLGISSISLGSDTGGSSRNPAAFTGIFGFKPSYGILSRHGLIPLVNSLDTPSILARTAEDCNTVLQVMSGRDPLDSTCINAPLSCFMQHRPLDGIVEYYNDTLSHDCWDAWNEAAKVLVAQGCKLREVSMPWTSYSIICYHVLAEADITSNMARFDGVKYGHRSDCGKSTFAMYSATRSESLNEVVRRRIFAGNYFLMKRHCDEYFGQALRLRRLIKTDFDRAFRELKCDVLLTPVTSDVAPLFSELSDSSGYVRERADDFYTQPSNMAGVPAVSVPFTRAAQRKDLPLAVQIIADYMNDGLVLDVAAKLREHCMLATG
ncbi:unnamed protein product [Gongylonema pulchrum]|uniref:Glutamyl-tRNA(Gln) amidotransferase subunit A, mitochondrial n=1 Tax=Gongylonema pulchrum TaxID=637853 RepID=A0A183DQZ2_9BILA|nr:unnamed protein product [Gongylonema pulchrum]